MIMTDSERLWAAKQLIRLSHKIEFGLDMSSSLDDSRLSKYEILKDIQAIIDGLYPKTNSEAGFLDRPAPHVLVGAPERKAIEGSKDSVG